MIESNGQKNLNAINKEWKEKKRNTSVRLNKPLKRNIIQMLNVCLCDVGYVYCMLLCINPILPIHGLLTDTKKRRSRYIRFTTNAQIRMKFHLPNFFSLKGTSASFFSFSPCIHHIEIHLIPFHNKNRKRNSMFFFSLCDFFNSVYKIILTNQEFLIRLTILAQKSPQKKRKLIFARFFPKKKKEK